MTVGAAGPYAASPIPTKTRVIKSTLNVAIAASPVAPEARLHKITPIPMIVHRRVRSASQPKTGAPTMYETMNAVASSPVHPLASGSPGSKK
jgi:hypothetical protein